ncbi:MAG: hypothetical protein ABI557_12405 [Aureliella sp.]
MGASKAERFDEFIRWLALLPPVDSVAGALTVLSAVLNAVEEGMPDISSTPENWQSDGRMYPPQMDSSRDVPGREDLIRFRSRGHNTIVRNNGAIKLRDLQNNRLFQKPGADGCGVDL